jgi:hypothetical protein
MIAGNHEFYGGSWTHEVAHMRRRALGTSVHVLEQESIDFPALGLRVAGATLWTNYAYLGDPEWSMRVAAAGMNDHRVIRYGKSALQPMHTLRRHERTVRWLAEEGERARRDGVPLLVVTHHPPVPEGLGPRQTEDRYARRLRASYVSDLAQLIAEVGAVSWIFGHTHVRRDFMVSGTRMLSNGRGYPNYDGPTPGFDPLLVVDPLRPTPVGKAITGTETSS